jgi:hypothetical protein
MRQIMNTDITTRRFAANPSKVRLVATAMGLYIALVMWPALDLCLLLLGADPLAFSLQRGAYAAGIAIAFSFYAYWQMGRLCLKKS